MATPPRTLHTDSQVANPLEWLLRAISPQQAPQAAMAPGRAENFDDHRGVTTVLSDRFVEHVEAVASPGGMSLPRASAPRKTSDKMTLEMAEEYGDAAAMFTAFNKLIKHTLGTAKMEFLAARSRRGTCVRW